MTGNYDEGKEKEGHKTVHLAVKVKGEGKRVSLGNERE